MNIGEVSQEDEAEAVPRDVHRHLLVGGGGQDPEQLVEHGGQELDHHVALHGVETLRGRSRRIASGPTGRGYSPSC